MARIICMAQGRESTVTLSCVSCGRPVTIGCTPEQVDAWRGGQLIQNAMPNVPREEREMLLSGLCNTCFREMCDEQDGDR